MNKKRRIYAGLKVNSTFFLVVLGICSLIFNPNQAIAKGNTSQDLIEVKQQLQKLREEQAALEKRLEEMEYDAIKKLVPTQSTDVLKMGLSGLFSGGMSSVENIALEKLQAGGHDPNRNGFTVQNVELSINSTVDPYFDAQANFIFLIDSGGETVVELEEVFFTTRNLPWGLQAKGGQYFTEFGRLNPQHPHNWDFVDQPVVLSRFFGGDGLRSQGVRFSKFIPTSWYSEFSIGAQNARGETVTSFLYEEGEEIAGHVLGQRQARNFGDLLHSVRWLNSFDVSDNTSMNLGFSGLIGPNASGGDTDTTIWGADLYLKWQSDYSQKGFPFLSWHTEWLSRRYEAGDVGDPSREILTDSGIFTQLLWGFKPGWVAGMRLEDVKGHDPSDPSRDHRKRLAANLTWYLTEFSKLRLQYNHDRMEHSLEDKADSLWLQMEFSLGSHMAHKF